MRRNWILFICEYFCLRTVKVMERFVFFIPCHYLFQYSYEPHHDKTNKMSVRTAKTQISLGICPVWSESSLSAWRKLGSLATHWAHTLIRLGGCPGWSESSLGALSFCWFCHVVALICIWGELDNAKNKPYKIGMFLYSPDSTCTVWKLIWSRLNAQCWKPILQNQQDR